MTVVVLGIDALDPELVDSEAHPNLTLEAHHAIDTIGSSAGEPSTHELWPTIITGLPPEEHGILLDDGVEWGNPVLDLGSRLADYVLPESVQTRLGAWLLTNTETDAFRKPATYYGREGLSTLFDGRAAKPIGIPNYVVDPEEEDREHTLRRSLGDLFERDEDAMGSHRSSDPWTFYEQCLEMLMIRLARARRAYRSGEYELVFAYTSGLDLVGHVAYADERLQIEAYAEADEFVGELRDDLGEDDELLLVSDHGLQDGVHTDEAMVASTSEQMVESIGSVLNIRDAVESELRTGGHEPTPRRRAAEDAAQGETVREQLEGLGYM